MNITVITDQQVEELTDYPSLISVMDDVFAACAKKQVDIYPVILSCLRGSQDRFSVKSGCNYATSALGLKCGGYRNANASKNLDRHQSTVLLLDIETGQPRAIVAGNALTSLRTAAVAAAATRRLARKNSKHVAVLGTGRQALYQLKALCEIRPIERVSAWSRSSKRVEAFGDQVRSLGLSFTAASTPAAAAKDADIIVTVTPSTEPLIRFADVAPGTHINAMGSDGQGKRELATDLLEASRIWTDDVHQASMIGECQYLSSLARVSEMGSLLINDNKFDRDENEITIFDGTGLALQDLAAANLVISTAIERGCAQTISL